MGINDIIHDGVSIKIYSADEPDKVVIHFNDDITAYYKTKKAIIKDKGIYCNGISSILSQAIKDGGVPTYFIRKLDENEQLCYRVDVIPLSMIVRNVIAGSLAKRLGLKPGTVPEMTIYELCYKSEELGDPLINDSHAVALGLVSADELRQIHEMTRKINGIIRPMFDKVGITLVDFKIEFGRMPDGSLAMADDITPDNSRLWDKATGLSLDKDRFRHDNGMVGDSYRSVYEKLKSLSETK